MDALYQLSYRGINYALRRHLTWTILTEIPPLVEKSLAWHPT